MRLSTAIFVFCLCAGILILVSCSALPATQGDLDEAMGNMNQGLDTVADGLASGSLFKTLSGTILALIGAIGVGARTLRRYDEQPFESKDGIKVTEDEVVEVVRQNLGKPA